MALLEVNDLSHYFGDKLLYKNSSFEIYKGEHVGIVGKNGSGKTTLLNTLIGEVIPDSGNIKWQKNINIGYLDQYININNNLKIFEYSSIILFIALNIFLIGSPIFSLL